MVKRRFVCEKCGDKFTLEVFEPGEAQEKRVPAHPVRCPRCGGQVKPA